MSPPGTGARDGGRVGSGAEATRDVKIRRAERTDVPLLLELYRELAVYEHLEDRVTADEQKIERALFGERPVAHALIAQRGDEPAGYAVFFTTYSTFRSTPGVWLEDVFVRPAQRRGGVGRALLAAVAARARELGAERMEWSALDWNELALGFYRGLGAQTMGGWITHRLEGADLDRLAGED